MPIAYANEYSSIQKIPMSVTTEELLNLAMHESRILNDGAIVTTISYDEYESSNKIAYDHIDTEEKSIRTISQKSGQGGYYYFDYKNTYSLNNKSDCPFKADLHAKLKMYTYYSYAQIEEIKGVHSSPTPGTATSTWTQTYAGGESTTGSFPCGKVNLYADGYFTVDTSVSTGVSVSVLKSLGFSQSTSYSMIWTSQVLHMYGSYKCYHT